MLRAVAPLAGVDTGPFILSGIETGLTAHAGGTQAAALALSVNLAIHHITVCATAGDSVKLPAATVGQVHFVKNTGAAQMQIYGTGTDTIDDVAAATGIAHGVGVGAIYNCDVAGKWYSYGVSWA